VRGEESDFSTAVGVTGGSGETSLGMTGGGDDGD
jgi:hypothetical protein